MTRGGMRAVLIGLAVAGACLSWLGNSLISYAGTDMMALYGGFAAVIIGITALWLIFLQIRRRHDGDAVSRAGGSRGSYVSEPLPFLLPASAGQGGELELADGQRLMVEVFARLQEAAVLLDASGTILAITPSAGRQLDAIAIGQRLRDGFDPEDWDYGLARARHTGQPLQASLRRLDGSDLLVRINDLGPGGGIVVTLPPRSRSLGHVRLTHPSVDDLRRGDQPLTVLPMVSLWVASAHDGDTVMPLAVGTVRLAGTRVFKTMAIDLFIDPGRPLPATAPGGVSAYLGAPDFMVSWPVIAEALRGCAIVGIDVERALADLLATANRYGLPLPTLGPVLDLARLAAVIVPDVRGDDLQTLATKLGCKLSEVAPARALFAPALWQAELAANLLPKLAQAGVVTQADALTLAGVAPETTRPGLSAPDLNAPDLNVPDLNASAADDRP